MKKIAGYILVMFITVIAMPALISKTGAGVKEFAIVEFKRNYEVGNATISVYLSDEKKIEVMDIEEYLKGVVAAEMPANFELEAMKAQAVAARTYALSRKEGLYRGDENLFEGADVSTDVRSQVWVSKEIAYKRWGKDANANWKKVEEAVSATSGKVLVYDKILINPLFHSNSGNITENIKDVWATQDVPYLRSVKSAGEETYTAEYNGILNISFADFTTKLKAVFPDLKFAAKDITTEVKILNRTETNRVKEIKIGNLTLKGTDFRMNLGLKSTNFTIEKSGQSSFKILTVGNGHGVGMSQCGADFMAKQGKAFAEILKYYYLGTEVVDYK